MTPPLWPHLLKFNRVIAPESFACVYRSDCVRNRKLHVLRGWSLHQSFWPFNKAHYSCTCDCFLPAICPVSCGNPLLALFLSNHLPAQADWHGIFIRARRARVVNTLIFISKCLWDAALCFLHSPEVWFRLGDMSESSSDTESSCGWTVISNEVSLR